MNAYYFYSSVDGVFSGAGVYGMENDAQINCPSGFSIYCGIVDEGRNRMDLQTMELVPYQPPSPAADEWQTWSWDAGEWAWVSVPTEAALARDARSERDRLLLACDWTQLADVPQTTRELWEPYRQLLRDITDQSGFPAVIDWPDTPA